MSSIIKEGAFACTGTITSQGKYADKKDIYEITIHKSNQDMLPHTQERPEKITLAIGNNDYYADVHENKARVVWISSVLYERTPRRKQARLVYALEMIGLKNGDKVKIRPSEDGAFSLGPL